jgi:hypothetical protein
MQKRGCEPREELTIAYCNHQQCMKAASVRWRTLRLHCFATYQPVGFAAQSRFASGPARTDSLHHPASFADLPPLPCGGVRRRAAHPCRNPLLIDRDLGVAWSVPRGRLFGPGSL